MPALPPIRRCLDLSGRASRAQFWRSAALLAAAVMLAVTVGIRAGGREGTAGAAILLLLALPPLVALMVRRMHDVGRGAGWLAMGLVPVLGPMWLAGWFAVEGDRGANRFGVDPKGRHRPAALAH